MPTPMPEDAGSAQAANLVKQGGDYLNQMMQDQTLRDLAVQKLREAGINISGDALASMMAQLRTDQQPMEGSPTIDAAIEKTTGGTVKASTKPTAPMPTTATQDAPTAAPAIMDVPTLPPTGSDPNAVSNNPLDAFNSMSAGGYAPTGSAPGYDPNAINVAPGANAANMGRLGAVGGLIGVPAALLGALGIGGAGSRFSMSPAAGQGISGLSRGTTNAAGRNNTMRDMRRAGKGG